MKLEVEIPDREYECIKLGKYEGNPLDKYIVNSKPLVECTTEDCVSKQAVLDLIADDDLSMGQVVRGIHALPPVIPIRPRGHWVWELDETPSTPISPYELNYAGWVCSCCHEFPDDVCEWDDPDEPPTYKFCPNCGSDNREM